MFSFGIVIIVLFSAVMSREHVLGVIMYNFDYHKIHLTYAILRHDYNSHNREFANKVIRNGPSDQPVNSQYSAPM